jgi:hypothetical protein
MNLHLVSILPDEHMDQKTNSTKIKIATSKETTTRGK